MQYYNISEKVKRKPTTLRILALVNAVLFVGLMSVLLLPFVN